MSRATYSRSSPKGGIDPRGNTIQVQRFELLGRPAFTGSADEGYDGTTDAGETLILA